MTDKPAPETDEERRNRIRSSGYRLADFAPFQGYDRDGPQLPNFEEMKIGVVASMIACGAGLVADRGAMYARINGRETARWARYFYNTTQRGDLDGTGYVLIYGDPYADSAVGGRFALCQHKKIMRADAVPSRGWHPGHCDLCGLDMSVDSGD